MTCHLLKASKAVIDVIVFTFTLKYVSRKTYSECLLMDPSYIAWINLSWFCHSILVVHRGYLYAEHLVKPLASLSVNEDQRKWRYISLCMINRFNILFPWQFLSIGLLNLVNINSSRLLKTVLTKKSPKAKQLSKMLGDPEKKKSKGKKKKTFKTFTICSHFCLETTIIKTVLVTETGGFPLALRCQSRNNVCYLI